MLNIILEASHTLSCFVYIRTWVRSNACLKIVGIHDSFVEWDKTQVQQQSKCFLSPTSAANPLSGFVLFMSLGGISGRSQRFSGPSQLAGQSYFEDSNDQSILSFFPFKGNLLLQASLLPAESPGRVNGCGPPPLGPPLPSQVGTLAWDWGKTVLWVWPMQLFSFFA